MVKYMDYAFVKINTLCLFFIAKSINKYKLIVFDRKFLLPSGSEVTISL